MEINEFIEELNKINIFPTKEQLDLLDNYYNIVIEENKHMNLTGITEKKEFYLKHFYDSLTLSKIIELKDEHLCDIGTGAGFPGLVLKIMFPSLKITLIESNGKKCNFLNIVKEKLGLENVEIINERAEIYSIKNREIYDIVTSRAVAPLKHLLEYSVPIVKENGYYIAMKSNIENEIENIENYYKKLDINLEKKITLNLPKEGSLRTLILYKKNKKTNIKYPRKYTEIKKKDI